MCLLLSRLADKESQGTEEAVIDVRSICPKLTGAIQGVHIHSPCTVRGARTGTCCHCTERCSCWYADKETTWGQGTDNAPALLL
jgi:hypothetical protein